MKIDDQSLLIDYIEGELDNENARRVEARLAAEPELARLHRELGRTLDQVAEADGFPPPAGYDDYFYQRLKARMCDEGLSPDRPYRPSVWSGLLDRLRFIRPVPAAVAAVLLVIMVIGLSTRIDFQQTDPQLSPDDLEQLALNDDLLLDAFVPVSLDEEVITDLESSLAEQVDHNLLTLVGDLDESLYDDLLPGASDRQDLWALSPDQLNNLYEELERKLPVT